LEEALDLLSVRILNDDDDDDDDDDIYIYIYIYNDSVFNFLACGPENNCS